MEADRLLVKRVLAGEREAFAVLVGRYEHAVFAVALKVLRDRGSAEDAAQDAFVAAYRKLPELRDPGTFGPWLLVIARNHALRKARNSFRAVPLCGGDESAPTPELRADEDELGAVMDALDRLPAHERQVVMLRYFEDRPVAEVARITGRSVGTVTKQISRALKKLRERLKAE